MKPSSRSSFWRRLLLVARSVPDEYRELVRDFAHATRVQESRADVKEYRRVLDELRNPAKITRFMELVDEDRAADPEIVDALVWVSRITPTFGSSEPLMRPTATGLECCSVPPSHRQRENRPGDAGDVVPRGGSQAAIVLFREAPTRSPHRDVRGRAAYWLAMYLKNNAELISTPKQPAVGIHFRQRLEKLWGKDAVEKLAAADAETLLKEAEELFALVVDQYGDVFSFGQKKDDEPLGGHAWKQLHELRDLAVGKRAPDIVGEDAGKGLKLSDYHGQVVLLTFSGNWMPQCTAMYPHVPDAQTLGWKAICHRQREHRPRKGDTASVAEDRGDHLAVLVGRSQSPDLQRMERDEVSDDLPH